MGYGIAVRLAFLLICCAVLGLGCSAAPRLEEMATCPRLWTGIAVAPDGRVWFTTSQLHLGPHPPAPYRIFRLEGSAD
jgi:hypothetical protein